MTDHEKRIREALEAGPTEGPFQVVRGGTYCWDIKTTDSYDVATTHGYVRNQVDSLPTANFIAACNPSAIRALLADLDAMRGALERIAAWHKGDDVTPSFDEPHAAAIARNALTGVSDADGAQDAPIPCDVFAGGSLFKKGTPFAELAEHMETEAARLVWAMAHMGMSNDYSRDFTIHVLRVGGIVDIHDCRTFIDAALKGAAP